MRTVTTIDAGRETQNLASHGRAGAYFSTAGPEARNSTLPRGRQPATPPRASRPALNAKKAVPPVCGGPPFDYRLLAKA